MLFTIILRISNHNQYHHRCINYPSSPSQRYPGNILQFITPCPLAGSASTPVS